MLRSRLSHLSGVQRRAWQLHLSAAGSWVAFEALGDSTPAGKGLLTLVTAHLADDGALDFPYLADLGRK